MLPRQLLEAEIDQILTHLQYEIIQNGYSDGPVSMRRTVYCIVRNICDRYENEFAALISCDISFDYSNDKWFASLVIS